MERVRRMEGLEGRSEDQDATGVIFGRERPTKLKCGCGRRYPGSGWLLCFSNTGFVDFSSLLELHSCCAACWGDCLVSDSLWKAPFNFCALQVFFPFSRGISIDRMCLCTTSPNSIMVTFEKVERSPEEKTPLDLFHSFFTSHGCPAPNSWALFRGSPKEMNYPVLLGFQSSFFDLIRNLADLFGSLRGLVSCLYSRISSCVCW